MGEVLGYARVSTTDQDAQLQHDALTTYGCTRVFTDTASGTLAHREQFARLSDQLRDGDTLVVWRLDRLGRSVSHLIEQLEDLQARGVGLVSIQEAIDTTTPGGRLVFHVFSALAQFERDLIVERTTAGLAAARARGRVGGRPEKLSEQQIDTARALYESGSVSVAQIGRVLGVSRSTIYRTLRKHPKP